MDMKRKMNLRALFANVLIMLLLGGMLTARLTANGMAPGTANVAAGVVCGLAVALPMAAYRVKVRMTNKKTGQVKVMDTPFVTLWLMSRLTRPFSAGINKEVWENHLMENLFPNNSLLEDMMDESEYVNYLTVHSPQAGGVPAVLVDPVFPLNGGNGLAVTQRTDVTLDWNIHVFFCGPFIINNAETVQLSYSKRESVLYNMEMQIRRVITENILIYCAPTGTATLPDGVTTNANVYRTSGVTNNDPGNVQASVAYLPGATNNRLNFTLFDFQGMKLNFDVQDIPEEDRNVVMSSNAEAQLIKDMIATKYRESLSDIFDLKTGKIDRLMGFKIHHRSKVMTYTNAATPVVKAYGAATATTDNDAMLFWQKGHLAKAVGEVIMYEQIGSPKDGGDIYSILIRCGATKKRTSELGVAALVQAAAA